MGFIPFTVLAANLPLVMSFIDSFAAADMLVTHMINAVKINSNRFIIIIIIVFNLQNYTYFCTLRKNTRVF